MSLRMGMIAASIGCACTASQGAGMFERLEAQRAGVEEWQLLGPAFSQHFSQQAAPVRQQAQWHECRSEAAENGCYRAVDGRYYKVNATTQRGWYQNNPGLGVAWTRRHDDYSLSYSVGLVDDSFGRTGTIGLAAWLWPVKGGALRIDAGLAGGLWYRTERDQGERAVVPVLMPALTVVHRPSRLGLNVGFAPRATVSGSGNRVDALMVQTTLAF